MQMLHTWSYAVFLTTAQDFNYENGISLEYLFLIFIDFVFLLVGALDWGEETSEMETIPLQRMIRSHSLATGQ